MVKKDYVVGFDALRAGMLLLLIVFHCGVSFMVSGIEEEWFYRDDHPHIVFDGLIGWIHSFRHPVFFLISGYLTERMFIRYSFSTALRKRILRITLPFLITLVTGGFAVNFLFAKLNGIEDAFSWGYITAADTIGFHTNYVWFLYYLSWYSVIHLLLRQLNLISVLEPLFKKGVWLVLFPVLLVTLLIGGEANSMYGSYSFIPDTASFGGYFLFYLIGILLERTDSDFNRIKKYCWVYLGIGSVFLLSFYILSILKMQKGINPNLFSVDVSLTYTAVVLFNSFGILGLALRYYTARKSVVTYLAKSSYFLYLIHLPFVLVLLLLFRENGLNPFLKFILILFATLTISLILNFFWRKIWNDDPPV